MRIADKVAIVTGAASGIGAAMDASSESDLRGLIAAAESTYGPVDLYFAKPLDVADAVLKALEEERFLMLPHPEVLGFFQRKSADYDRWLQRMRHYQEAVS